LILNIEKNIFTSVGMYLYINPVKFNLKLIKIAKIVLFKQKNVNFIYFKPLKVDALLYYPQF